jgi:hypothetical protein
MKTISVSFTETEFEKFGIKSESIEFKVLLERISIELARQAAYECHQIAKKYGFAETSMDEINAEIKEIRKNAKNNFS